MTQCRDMVEASAQACTLFLENDAMPGSEDLPDADQFGEQWADRHNQEIWHWAKCVRR
jgi:hypothetical protein